MAAHLRSYLHSAFAFGMGDEFSYTRPRQDVSFELTSNPAAAVPRDPDAFCAGERHLSSSEVGRVWHGISDCEQQTGLALKLILAVGGQRVQEVVFARRTEFDLDARLWTLPAERVKNGREHVVPLSERACAILREALHVAGDSDFLFPKRGKPEAHMPCTSLNRAAHRIAERLGMAPWSPRDLRRTSRTWLSEAGEDDGVLDRHFNHGFGNSVGQKHYDRAQHLEEKRAVMARWDRLLALALGETPAPMPDETSAEQIGKVIPLRAAK